MSLVDYLDECQPQVIVETGCLYRTYGTFAEDDGWSTLHIAKWCELHPNTAFHSVDIEQSHIDVARAKLYKDGVHFEPIFHCGDSVYVLKHIIGPVDFAYLDSCDGYLHGLEEFNEVVRLGAKMVVMDDYIGKGVWAAEHAKNADWDVKQEERYTVIRR